MYESTSLSHLMIRYSNATVSTIYYCDFHIMCLLSRWPPFAPFVFLRWFFCIRTHDPFNLAEGVNDNYKRTPNITKAFHKNISMRSKKKAVELCGIRLRWRRARTKRFCLNLCNHHMLYADGMYKICWYDSKEDIKNSSCPWLAIVWPETRTRSVKWL